MLSDHPKTIKRRFLSVFITSLISTIILIIFIGDLSLHKLSYSLGLAREDSQSWSQLVLQAIFLPLLQTSVLFIGPIVVSLRETKDFSFSLDQLLDLIVIRNYVIAPITEEFIFRGVLSAVLWPCCSVGTTLVTSSIVFGAAHSHHYLFEKNLRSVNGWAAFEQMLYTSLFGMYASLLYFRSKLIVTPILVHSFCNWMGLPDQRTITSSTLSLVLTLFGLLSWILSLIYICLNL